MIGDCRNFVLLFLFVFYCASVSASNNPISQLPYLKFITNVDEELQLQQNDLVKDHLFDGVNYEIRDTSWKGSYFFTRKVNGHLNGTTNQGADATSHLGKDWLVWADVDKIRVKEIAPEGAPTQAYVIHEPTKELTSLPAIASYRGELVVVWVEEKRKVLSRSKDGKTWSPPVTLDTTDYAYGSRIALTTFRNRLHLTYVLDKDTIFDSIFREDLSGYSLTYEVYDAPDQLVDFSVSAAAYDDKVLSFAFALDYAVQVFHTSEIGEFDGPFIITDDFQPRGVPAISYGILKSTEPQLFIVTPNSGGHDLHRKPFDELYTHYALSDIFASPASGAGSKGVLFNSAYKHNSINRNALGLNITSTDQRPCKRNVRFDWEWQTGLPQNVVSYELYVNDKKYSIEFPPGQRFLSMGLWVLPDFEHTIRVKANLSDGSAVASNEVKYTFDPCGAREVKVAVVRTKYDDIYDSFYTKAELENIFFTGNDSIANFFSEVSGDHISLVGGVHLLDGRKDNESDPSPPYYPIPGTVVGNCDSPDETGWGYDCALIPFEYSQFVKQMLPDDTDIVVYIVGGLGEEGDSTVRISGRSTSLSKTAIHEIAHKLGLDHSAGIECARDNRWSVPSSADDLVSSGCFGNKYADETEQMGVGGRYGRPFSVLNGRIMGYFDATHSEVVMQSGEYILRALDDAQAIHSNNELLELVIPISKNVNDAYHIEFRQFDPAVPTTAFSNTDEQQGLVIRMHNPNVVGRNLVVDDSEGMKLDFLATMQQPFLDPFRGIKISLLDINTEQNTARVEVEFYSTLINPSHDGTERLDWRDNAKQLLELDEQHSTFGDSSFVVPEAGVNYLKPPPFRTIDQKKIGTAISLDIFVPSTQADVENIGEIQLMVSVPSAGINDMVLGTKDLSNVLLDGWSTLFFNTGGEPLRQAFEEYHDEVIFTFRVELNSNLAPTLLDNFRFANSIRELDDPICQCRIKDSDGDGIADQLDTAPDVSSSYFQLNGSAFNTRGEIINIGEQTLRITHDRSQPNEAITIYASEEGGETPALVSACGGDKQLLLYAGDVKTFSCEASDFCSGTTDIGNTNWLGKAGNIYVDIDTSSCNFTEIPTYFSTLAGAKNIEGDSLVLSPESMMGATAIYTPSASGFRVILRGGSVTPDLAREFGWHINWQAFLEREANADLCIGSTDASEWVQLPNYWWSAYVDIDTSDCGFSDTPEYFTSLSGDKRHELIVGSPSVVVPTASGFRVYANFPHSAYLAGKTVAEFAQQQNWRVNWQARAKNRSSCVGSGEQVWQQENTRVISTYVDTSSCHLPADTSVITAFEGNFNSSFARGVPAIHRDSQGFQVFIYNYGGFDAGYANHNNWRVKWNINP